jgi:hypothetical protein
VASRTEEYRAKAKECEEAAEGFRDPNTKEQMLGVARQWRHMADNAEKHSR